MMMMKPISLLRPFRPSRFLSTLPPNKTLSLQNELPRLPVPPIEETISKFLLSTRPLLSDVEYESTTRKAASFLKGEGPELQSLLQQRAKQKENWFADWWLDMAYLGYRDPLPVWSSPGIIWPKREFSQQYSLSEQLHFAARVIAGALDFKGLLDRQTLPIEMAGPERPMDMNQYFRLYGTTRIPGENSDRQSFHPDSKHIIVIHNNNFFKLQVYGKDGKEMSEKQIEDALHSIVERSQVTAGPPIGVLTSDNRDNWYRAYEVLLQDNADTLNEITSSLFTVSLDNKKYSGEISENMTRCAYQSSTGLGPDEFGANRWYDKTMQFFIGEDGSCGMTYEHSPAEGPPLMVISDHILKYADVNSSSASNQTRDIPDPVQLDFHVSEILVPMIQLAQKNLQKLHEDIEFDILHFKSFGKEFIKSQKMSPDSFIQMAIQLAFYRLHGIPGATYESGGTRSFLHGRTDVIRSCSLESFDFTKKMESNKYSRGDKFASLKTAVTKHSQYAKMVTLGLGIDRHLQGFQKIAKENDLKIPELFSDAGYLKSSRMRLSTSQVPGKTSAVLCFGPLVQDGYGCCYNPRAEDIVMSPSSLRSCRETSASNFKEALSESFLDMRKVCE